MNDPKRQYSTTLMRAPFSGDGHTIVANRMVRNRNLSYKARGILTYLGSHVEGWETSEERLAEESTDKLHAVRSGLAELEEDGYMLRFREVLANGTRAGALWIFSDNPNTLPEHALTILEQLAAEGRRFIPLNGRTRESMKRRRPQSTPDARETSEPTSENHILEPDGQNSRSEPVLENPILDPTSDFPSLENPMLKNTTAEGEGEEGDAHAGASGDPSAGDEPQWGVSGRRRPSGPTRASADLIRTISWDVLLEDEELTIEEHRELAALADAARPVVQAQQGLSWEEYVAWLRQGWVRPDGRRTFNTFHGALRWRLLPEQIQGRAWAWACERRGVQAFSGARGGREVSPPGAQVHTATCGRHGTTLTGQGRCLPCEAEATAQDRSAQKAPAPEPTPELEDRQDEEPELEELDPQVLARMYDAIGQPPPEEYHQARAALEALRSAAAHEESTRR